MQPTNPNNPDKILSSSSKEEISKKSKSKAGKKSSVDSHLSKTTSEISIEELSKQPKTEKTDEPGFFEKMTKRMGVGSFFGYKEIKPVIIDKTNKPGLEIKILSKEAEDLKKAVNDKNYYQILKIMKAQYYDADSDELKAYDDDSDVIKVFREQLKEISNILRSVIEEYFAGQDRFAALNMGFVSEIGQLASIFINNGGKINLNSELCIKFADRIIQADIEDKEKEQLVHHLLINGINNNNIESVKKFLTFYKFSNKEFLDSVNNAIMQVELPKTLNSYLEKKEILTAAQWLDLLPFVHILLTVNSDLEDSLDSLIDINAVNDPLDFQIGDQKFSLPKPLLIAQSGTMKNMFEDVSGKDPIEMPTRFKSSEKEGDNIKEININISDLTKLQFFECLKGKIPAKIEDRKALHALADFYEVDWLLKELESKK